MKAIYIIVKELMECSRDVRSLIILLIMPLLLTSILAITFKDKLSNNIDLSSVKVYYEMNCSENEKVIIDEYLGVLENLGIKTIKERPIRLDGVSLEINSLSDIKVNYVSEFKSQGNLIHSLLDTFLKRYSTLLAATSKGNLSPQDLEVLQGSEYVIEKSLSDFKSPSSKDYYGIVMVTLTFMFSSVMGVYSIMRERNSGTLSKLYISPVSKESILIAKLIGTSLFLFLECTIILFISNKFMKVYMGPDLFPILIVLLSEIILAVSLGIFIGYMVKDTQSALLCIVIMVIVMGFLGGAFIPLSSLNSDFIYKASAISPLTYTNNAIFNFIYNSNIEAVVIGVLLNLVISSIVLIITGTAMEVRK